MRINLMEGTANPFQVSNISKLQDFYGLSYNDLFDENIMKDKGVKKDEIEYIVKNREFEFSKKSTVGFELRKGALGSERLKKLQDFYGFQLEDCVDINNLIKLGMNNEEILFVTGKDLEEKKEDKKETKVEDKGDEFNELREEHKNKFGKYPISNIKLETLKKKLGIK